MPELPEVETFKKYLDETSLDQKIINVVINDSRVLGSDEKLFKELVGKKFKESIRHGKYLFVDLNSNYIVLHFGMSGGLEYYNNEECY